EVATGGGEGVFAVGDGGTVLRRVGGAWWRVPTSTSENLRGAWTSPTGVLWAVGDEGTILSFDFPHACIDDGMQDGRETDVDCVDACTHGIWGTSDLSRVWGTADNDAWAVGSGGVILHYDGANWSKVPSHTGQDFAGLSGTSAGDAWAVGSDVLAHWDGTAWD